MNRIVSFFILAVMLFSTLTGCTSDALEIDEVSYVVMLGIDKGVSNKWRVTVKFPVMNKEKGDSQASKPGGSGEKKSSSEAQDGYTTVSVDASSIVSAINLIDVSIPRRLNFMHTKLVVISEEVAKNGLVGQFLAPIVRIREFRRTMHVVVSKGTAMEFVKESKPLVGKSLSKSIENLMEESSNTGLFPHVTLDKFYDDIKSPYNQAIAILGSVNDFDSFRQNGEEPSAPILDIPHSAGSIPRNGGNTTELFGCAVFDGDKMVGELDGEDNRALLIARGEFERGLYSIPGPEMQDMVVALDVRPARKRKVDVRFDGNTPKIELHINLEGDIVSIQSGINYESSALKPTLEKAFKERLEAKMNELIIKCKNMNADILKFGGYVSMHFSTLQEWEEYNWLKKFKDADITVKADFKIRRMGTILNSADIKSTKGE